MDIKEKLKVCATRDETDQLIIDVLEKLPQRVQKYILNNVVFFEFDKGVVAHTFITKYKHQVTFSEEYCIYPTVYQKFVIAHEIAHIMLGHAGTTTFCEEEEEQREKEANKLAKKWGYKKPSLKTGEKIRTLKQVNKTFDLLGEQITKEIEKL